MNRSVFSRAGLRLSLAATGEGQTMVFQHGLCGDAHQPAGLFPPGIGWRCLTLECRGHGQSEAGDAAQFSLTTFADDVAAMIEAEAAAPVVLGGISMGAAIALRLAVLRPDLVRGLVLVRPAWLLESAPANMAAHALVGDLLVRLPPAAAHARFHASALARHLAEAAPDNLASLDTLFARQPSAVTRDLLVGIAADGPHVTAPAVAALAMPTLVIGHQRDVVHPLSLARALAHLIPAASLVEVTAKADSQERHSEDVRAALAHFLGSL